MGNIIRNEVLFLVKIPPETPINSLSPAKLKLIIKTTKEYVFQFYSWRKNFELRKHYRIYKKTSCPNCGSKVVRKKTGLKKRLSYVCPLCQPDLR